VRASFAFLAFVLAASAASAQTTWYVDGNGIPPGSGTPADPYTSIQYAIDQPTTVSFDTILVAPGTYDETLNLMPSNKQLSVVSTGGPLVTVIAPSTGASSIVVQLGPIGAVATNRRLVGFTVQGHSGVNIGVRGTGTVKRCIVRDILGNSGQNAALFTDYDMIVEECTLVDNVIGIETGPFDGIFYMRNSLISGSSEVDVSDRVLTFSTSLHYCTWGTGPAPQDLGDGNLKGDPGFWNAPQDDVHLAFGSSSIDSGHPASPLDPDGSPIDRGALTYDAGYLPAIEVYCTAKTNSQGCAASIGATGGPAASASAGAPFDVTAGGVVTDTLGLLFYGHGRRAVPFLGGFHCVEPPTPRTAIQASGNAGAPCTGSFAFDFSAYVQSGLDPLLVPGIVIDAQYWYRDSADPLGFGSATSDAIEFAIAP
jgi:hypothetical protein